MITDAADLGASNAHLCQQHYSSRAKDLWENAKHIQSACDNVAPGRGYGERTWISRARIFPLSSKPMSYSTSVSARPPFMRKS